MLEIIWITASFKDDPRGGKPGRRRVGLSMTLEILSCFGRKVLVIASSILCYDLLVILNVFGVGSY